VLLGGSRLFERGLLAAGDAWRDAILRALDDGAPLVRFAALGVASWGLRDAALARRLEQRFTDPAASPDERGYALIALAAGGEPRAADLTADAVRATTPILRAHAATAAALSELPSLLEALSRDTEPRVRAAALRAAMALEEPAALLALATRDPHRGVRAEAYNLLARRPVLALGQLVGQDAASSDLRVERDDVARRALVEAVWARGRAERLERGATIALLERVAAQDPERSVRVTAIAALRDFGRPAPAPGAVHALDQIDRYRDVVVQTDQPLALRLETTAGPLDFALDCPAAPKGCLSLIQLVRQGFYDGLPLELAGEGLTLGFGDPGGTGHGDAGYRVREELTGLSFERPGVLYLARPFEDGGGSQLFLSLRPEPWSTGHEIALAHLVGGEESLARLGPGATVLGGSITALGAGARP
jgi:cyclophilin family peptidyl-prolyl cis-trans isomerase